MIRSPAFVLVVLLALLAGCAPSPDAGSVTLLNVSYDPTRELYQEFNAAFVRHWRETTGGEVTIRMSHGGSGSQARAVLDGLPADVVTLALAWDIEALRLNGALLAEGWQDRLPERSCPYTSTIVFLVRRGNPKAIYDWSDLVRPGVEVVTPNPKTSGGARWNYLAAWGDSLYRDLGSFEPLRDPDARDRVERARQNAEAFVAELFRHVPVLDRGARAATNTFVQNRIGDVLLAWENEALLATRELGPDAFEIVRPPRSILAEPPVAWLDVQVERAGTAELARSYLEYLFSPEGQEIVARHHFRSRDPEVLARHADAFPDIELFTVDDVFGGWAVAQAEHFDDGGVFDRIFLGGAKP